MNNEEDEEMKIIRENFQRLLEANCYRDKNGHFSSAKDAKTYSCTNAALKSGAITDKDKIKRGKVTSKGKITSPFGMNTSKDKSCGRKLMSGEDISPKYSCKDYNAKYENQEPEETALIADKNGSSEPRRAIAPPKTKPGKGGKLKTPRKTIRVRVKRMLEGDDKGKKDRRDDLFAGWSDMKRLSRGIISEDQTEFDLPEVIDAILVLIRKTTDKSDKAFIKEQIQRLGYTKNSDIPDACRARQMLSIEDWLKFQNANAKAIDGKLFDKAEGKK